ncbi:MAG: hypothetical protein HQK67_09495, partial [Desulfamplus sp.]|nr:hypothetical protein [Desulfamplus sp.]
MKNQHMIMFVALSVLTLSSIACANGVITKFEKVPSGEELLIKQMKNILQDKMFRAYPPGRMKRDAHPKNLGCLKAEFIVEPDIPTELKVGLFEFPQTYPAWIRISSASGKIESDKVKDLRGFAIKIMGVKGERFQTQDEEKEMRDEEKETRYQ